MMHTAGNKTITVADVNNYYSYQCY